MEKIDPLFQKMRIFRQKNDPFFKIADMPTFLKNRPFLREIQNDDAYSFSTGVAGPGGEYKVCRYREKDKSAKLAIATFVYP